MATATLRTATKKSAVETIKATNEVLATGVEIESKTTVAAPAAGGEAFDESLGLNGDVQEAVVVPPETTSVALEKPAQRQVATANFANDSEGSLEGEWAASDLKFPVLKIVQGSGPLSEKFPVGSVILGDEVLLAAAANPTNPEAKLRFVPLRLTKAYRENLDQEAYKQGQMPQIVKTVEEVEALGGTTQWIGRQKPSWSPCSTGLFLIEAPANTEHPGFAVEIDNKSYAVAAYYMTGGAYNSAAKPIFNNYLTLLQVPVFESDGTTQQRDAAGHLLRKSYMPKKVWTARFPRKKSGDFNVFSPEVRMTMEETSPALREYIAQVLGSDVQKTTDEE